LPASIASEPTLTLRRTQTRLYVPALCLSVALTGGALIAAQFVIMRLFAIGSWAHFGSLVVSLAMLGLGLSSAAICIARPLVERYGSALAGGSLILFAPLLSTVDLIAQQLPFNAVFLLADPQQKWRLAANFVAYLLPFIAGGMFLGIIFLRQGQQFGRVYFADLSGAGICSLVTLLAMRIVPPEDLVVVPVVLGLFAATLWVIAEGRRWSRVALPVAAAVSLAVHFLLPHMLGIGTLAISDYKGVSYARKLPDNSRVLHLLSSFGDVQAYTSSYLHFAPGLSDNAAFNLPELPRNAYLGLYLDGEGPIGVIRDLPPKDTAYFEYLPIVFPYLIKAAPDVFVAQLGGGISTSLALRYGARSVTVAESNPAILEAFGTDEVGGFSGHLLQNARVHVVGGEGRLFLEASDARYDIVDLSVTISAGLSNPGGFPIVERYGYTNEAMLAYMRALRPGGVLAVTLWNKEEPPKSVLKLYATMVGAARAFDPATVSQSFFAFGNYLSTATVLYKRGGFTAAEIDRLHQQTEKMSFDAFYYPGYPAGANDPAALEGLFDAYRNQTFSGGAAEDEAPASPDNAETLPATLLSRLVWGRLISGDWPAIADRYLFDTRPLTDNRPYFAGYIKPRDLPRIVDRLDLFQDEWGYLLLWATLGIATSGAVLLMALPPAFGWRTMVHDFPGVLGTVLYFACLGLGYLAVELALAAKFALVLGNYTISAAVVITGMLVFSGVGSLLSQRYAEHARRVLPRLLVAIGGILLAEALLADRLLEWSGALPFAARLVACFVLILPPALLMGFPMPLAMTNLARLGKYRVFPWAWGINGCFSVIGAAATPIAAIAFGLNTVLAVAGAIYVLAIPALGALFRPATPSP
jgi:predicted membrane-bound spermidine synthase